MQQIVASIRTAFPEAAQTPIDTTTELGSLPGWDSMNAVNLMLEINERCHVDLDGVPLTDATTVAELIAAVKERGGVI